MDPTEDSKPLPLPSDEPPATVESTEPVHHDTSLLAATVEPPPPAETSSSQMTVTAQLKDPEVKDYGWNTSPSKIAAPLIHGVPNDDIYTLVRRFNKQIFHVKAAPVPPPPGVLDLATAPEEEFSPDKLRATLERLYITVFTGLAAFAKHIARLRSWNEPRRTAGFCAGYYIAWFFNALLPALFITLVVLIIYPPARGYMFPPAPLSIISATTGNLQKPKADEVGSADSLTGAPEAHKGEAVEQEARHFVTSLGAVAISTAAGKGPGEDGNGNAVGGGTAEAEGVGKPATSLDGAVPDPVGMATGAIDNKHKASGDDASKDPAKDHVQDAIWSKMRPAMQILGNIADTWERFDNLLSPTPPFSDKPRFRLAGIFAPLAIVTYFTPAALFIRVTTFFLGFAFFGQPLINRGVHWLTSRVPNWREYLDLRRTLLKGVPTNAQLTLTLLRIAERNKSPLPPPPTSADGPTAPSSDTDSGSTTDSELPFDTSNYDVDTDDEGFITDDQEYDRLSHNGQLEENETTQEEQEEEKKKKKPGRKIAAFLRKTVKLNVEGALSVDRLKAGLGSESSKRRVGAITDPPLQQVTDNDTTENETKADDAGKTSSKTQAVPGPIEDGEGPSVFSARYFGKRGHILLIESATSPCLAFVYNKTARSILSVFSSKTKTIEPSDIHPEFVIPLSDVVELRKVGGFGWKAKMVIGWALNREVVDGLEVGTKDGKKWLLTAVRGRDELFNRLIAIGDQKWECW
ncbi:hypothetical protein K474DRAFT_1666801 [Panus rudis PR-1116 ss-1]|nr:hypothetical protein K474DRAFT_1666801 [Panus rudis PR-1116 ss-1]